MRDHVRIVGWCFIVYSALLVVLAVGLFAIIGGAGALTGDRYVMLITGAVGTSIAAILLVLSIPGLLTGFGLLKFRPWARILGIILAAINLLHFPLGTALGVYALVILLNAETTALFEQSAVTAA